MQAVINTLKYICILMGATSLVAVVTIVFHRAYFNFTGEIDPDLASKFGDFFGGFAGTLFSMLSVMLLIYTIAIQNLERSKNETQNRFFKMIDYHNENTRGIRVANIDISKSEFIEEGRRAFVHYKIQLKGLLETVNAICLKEAMVLTNAEKIDIAYTCFFYGLSPTWMPFIEKKLKRYSLGSEITREIMSAIEQNKTLRLGRTNQTELSSYFRNMYNAIKMVDSDKYLTNKEKITLVKIYRAQLSNPELYILFFNLASRFGRKWNENGYVERYQLLTNLPRDYCDGFDPTEFYKIHFEEDEI